MPQGYVVFVLHAHLPYVLSHGRWPHGSDWLNEAACEVYLPLLGTIRRLQREGKRANFTVNLTPVLCEMLGAADFRTGFVAYCRERRAAAADEEASFRRSGDDRMARRASFWRRFYDSSISEFSGPYREELVSAFRHFQDDDAIELTASSATHAYLPLLSLDSSVTAQIAQGVDTYRRSFGREPRGFWLPECAYRPHHPWIDPLDRDRPPRERKGLDELLSAAGLRYFFLDTHLLTGGEVVTDYGAAPRAKTPGPQPAAAVRLPGPYSDRFASQGRPGLPERFVCTTASVDTGGTEKDPRQLYRIAAPAGDPCAFFTRDPEMCFQVWSADHGYPGDADYLEFHKKSYPGGLRYWRVTDRTADLGTKQVYDPVRAARKVRAHALHFVEKLARAVREGSTSGGAPIITVAFDAELFGHWWFEGTEWLYRVASALSDGPVRLERASTVLAQSPPTETVRLPEGSWGEGGAHGIWYNKDTEWTWKHIYASERLMREGASAGFGRNTARARVLRQMGRELFLLQSSDWQFLMTTGTAREYARARFLGHLEAFNRCQSMLRPAEKGSLDAASLEALQSVEEKDRIFKEIKPEWFEERTA